jgi:hypothetical protein
MPPEKPLPSSIVFDLDLAEVPPLTPRDDDPTLPDELARPEAEAAATPASSRVLRKAARYVIYRVEIISANK